MDKLKKQRSDLSIAGDMDKLLENYYEQLMRWGLVLTRGDRGMAEDIVHDLCLHFSLSRPDLRTVTNMDGYLYICLRNMYMSEMASSSREAMQLVSIADFDSAEFALAAGPMSDLLQRQNDLIRVCSYCIWRKDSSKSASYFILHFFQGYFRREVAAIARVPLAAIYNKLKIARTEIEAHLEGSTKLQIMTREQPPVPRLLLSPIPSTHLFNLLRVRILQARHSPCLPEPELLAHYSSSVSASISCELLSHIVSCERCLAIIDRATGLPRLEERGPIGPLETSIDKTDSISEAGGASSARMFSVSLQKERERIFEHRPRTLSIAVNGRIAASHNVQGDQSRLSSRFDHPEDAQFVEVFSEQQLRLAFLPIQDRPPAGPHMQTQRTALSDNRWLELTLSFDGLGLHGEVVYFDPTLATGSIAAELDEQTFSILLEPSPQVIERSFVESSFKSLVLVLRRLTPRPAMVWALVLACVISLTGYLAYRRSANVPLTASQILSQSIKAETAGLQHQTEHRTFEIDLVSPNGTTENEGTLEIWRDGDGNRNAQRLYDVNHRILAADWHTKSGNSSYARKLAELSGTQRTLLTTGLWKQDVSSEAFKSLTGNRAQVNRVGTDYELTSGSSMSGHPQLISATLVLNRKLHPVRQILRLHKGDGFEEVRFMERAYQLRPTSEIGDSVFMTDDDRKIESDQSSSLFPSHRLQGGPQDVRLTQLDIGVLYQLSQVDADIGEPIEVVRTPDGQIRVQGTLANNARLAQIRSRLEALPDRQYLDVRLIPRSSIGIPARPTSVSVSPSATTYATGTSSTPATEALRRHFQSEGLSGMALNTLIQEFSRDALEHAQHALQDAYALDRLGNVLSGTGATKINLISQQQWTEMVKKHASDLETQLNLLDNQFVTVSSLKERLPVSTGETAEIHNPAEFTRAANELLHQMQDLEHNVGRIFANTPSEGEQETVDGLVIATRSSLPIDKAKEIGDFAGRLAVSVKSVASGRNRTQLPVTPQ